MTIRTNIELDRAQVKLAKQVTGLKTTRAVVHFALQRLTATSRALSTLAGMSGKVHFRRGYSYKRAR